MLYNLCFDVISNGSRRFFNRLVMIKKARGRAGYLVKWDFSDALQNKSNKARYISAEDPRAAVAAFVQDELYFTEIEITDFNKISF